MTSPFVEEKAVRAPIALNERAYFFNPRHRDYINDPTTSPPIHQLAETKIYAELLIVLAGIMVGALLLLIYPTVGIWVFWGTVALGISAFPYFMRRIPNAIPFKEGEQGEIVLGKIVSCTGKVQNNKSYFLFSYEIITHYVFPTPEGTQLVGLDTRRIEDKVMLLPTANTPVYVLYFSDSEHYLL